LHLCVSLPNFWDSGLPGDLISDMSKKSS
jgi:hypothetical protein